VEQPKAKGIESMSCLSGTTNQKPRGSGPWACQLGQTTKIQEDQVLGLAKWDNQPKTKGMKSMGYLNETNQNEVEQAKG